MRAPPELHVDSLTGVELVLSIAGPGARSFAFILDWQIRVILALAWFVLAALAYNGAWSLAQPLAPDPAWFIFVLTPPAAIFLLYHPVLEIAMRGRTPGKRMAGLRIASRTGGTPGISALLTRNVFRIIDSFPLLYGVGLLLAIMTREHVRIGDMAAGTVLVYEREAHELPEPADSRMAGWKSAALRARRLARDLAQGPDEAGQLVQDYGLLAHELARVRRTMPGSAVSAYLETAYAQVHAAIQSPGWQPGRALVRFFADELPQVVSELRVPIAWSTVLFVLSGGAGYRLVQTHPGLIGLFASPELIVSVQKGHLWTEGLLNIVPSSVLSVQILANNIVVSLVAWCAGCLFGLGTIYILGLNGMMLGAVFAFTGQHGLAASLFSFVIPHAPVEVSVMCLSGAAGAAVGEALVRPRNGTRMESFRAAVRQSGRLLAACVLLLVGSGLIEGFISPDPDVPLWARSAIGTAYWLFMLALLRGWLFRLPGSAGRSHTGRLVIPGS